MKLKNPCFMTLIFLMSAQAQANWFSNLFGSAPATQNTAPQTHATQSDQDCVFCKIIARKEPATIIEETKDLIVFKNRSMGSEPNALIHYLIVPKKHIASLNDLTPEDLQTMGEIIMMAQKLSQKYTRDGQFNLLVNTGSKAGQTVFHLHFHFNEAR